MIVFSKSSLFLLVIFICKYTIAKQCNDCVTITSCEAAIAASKNINETTLRKFQKAMCDKNLKSNVPKICCSDFESSPNAEIRFLSIINKPILEDLELHPNFYLLPQNCGSIYGNRIHGGEYAVLFEFPWMALLSYKIDKKYNFLCGGTIINSKYILTAAHCLTRKELIGIRVGEYDMRHRIDCAGEYFDYKCGDEPQDIIIEKKVPHSGYRTYPIIENDIALLRLKRPINFELNNVFPICLPIVKSLINNTLAERLGTVAGWGYTETGQSSKILKKADLLIMNQIDCNRIFNRYSGTKIIQNHLCAGGEGKDSCNGDSGGPLILEEDYKNVFRMVQYGIVSYGSKQCGVSLPGVYTDVRKYLQWILDNIEE